MLLVNAHIAQTKEVLPELIGKVATARSQLEPCKINKGSDSSSISPLSANIMSSSMVGAVVYKTPHYQPAPVPGEETSTNDFLVCLPDLPSHLGDFAAFPFDFILDMPFEVCYLDLAVLM